MTHNPPSLNGYCQNSGQTQTALDLYNDFEREILKRVFEDSYSSNLKTYDLINHLDYMAAEHDLADSVAYWSIREELHDFACQHRALIRGAVGERRAYNAIKHASSEKRMLTNVVFEHDGETVEIDCLVVTGAGVFCVEAKNYSYDLTVEWDGSFKNAEGKPYNNYNIGERMAASKYVVSSIIGACEHGPAEVPVYGILLNASRASTITNRFPHIDLCSLGNVAAYIDSVSSGCDLLSFPQIEKIAATLEAAAKVLAESQPTSFERIADGLDGFLRAIDSATRIERQDDNSDVVTKPISQQNAPELRRPTLREGVICLASLAIGALGGYAVSKSI